MIGEEEGDGNLAFNEFSSVIKENSVILSLFL